jgi:NADH-quinone oxidoreductase subunit L
MGAGLEIFLMILAIGAGVGGWFIARSIYGRDRGLAADRSFVQRFPALHRVLENKYYVDEIYDRIIIGPLVALSTFFWKGIDMLVIDGAINTGAATAEVAGEVSRFSTTGNVRHYALYFFAGIIVLFIWLIL